MSNPTISATPAGVQWAVPGGGVVYSITVKNNNSANCTSNSFNLQAILRGGWSVTSSTPVITVAPGAAVTASMQINSAATESSGTFAVSIGAANSVMLNYSAAVPRDIALCSTLGVTASSDKPSYTSNQTAVLAAYVTGNGSPLSGATLTFTIRKPSGQTVVVSAVSGANGYANYSYRLNRKQDPAGTYQVTANATLNGMSGVGSAGFDVR
jgi:hypothetical protein